MEIQLEQHIIQNLNKKEKYEYCTTAINGLVTGETDLIANLANVTALLKDTFKWWWVGFYLVKDNYLVLGPFQGPAACTRIAQGKGVCGTSWQTRNTIIVDNVDDFPGHIACSPFSKSEIVVPVIRSNDVVAVLDIDSEVLSGFDKTDSEYLNAIAGICSGFNWR